MLKNEELLTREDKNTAKDDLTQFPIKEFKSNKNTFEVDLKLSKDKQVLCDNIYKNTMNIDKIERYSKDKEFILDKKYHIDCLLKSESGLCFTMQEKVLRNRYSCLNTFTIEYMQNKYEQGEFFSICSQLYFSGYLNQAEDAFDKYIIINVANFKQWIYESKWIDNNLCIKRSGGSNASFLYVDYRCIPQNCIFKKFGDNEFFEYEWQKK
jgi:hypothetical protein